MTKQKSLLMDLNQALQRLKEAVALKPTRIHKDATIQRFEFTFELAWKLMKSVMEDKGVRAGGPKDWIRRAAQMELVADPQTWFRFLEARNLMTHVYKEKLADEVYKKAKKFPVVVEELIKKVGEELAEKI